MLHLVGAASGSAVAQHPWLICSAIYELGKYPISPAILYTIAHYAPFLQSPCFSHQHSAVECNVPAPLVQYCHSLPLEHPPCSILHIPAPQHNKILPHVLCTDHTPTA